MNPIWKKRLIGTTFGLAQDDTTPICPKGLVDVEFRNVYGLILPAFDYEGLIWDGASQLLGQINYTLPNGFSLINIATLLQNPSFVLCVRYRRGNAIVRYKLWEGIGEVLYFPLYTGQPLPINVSIEIWSINNSNLIPDNNTLIVHNTPDDGNVAPGLYHYDSVAGQYNYFGLSTNPWNRIRQDATPKWYFANGTGPVDEFNVYTFQINPWDNQWTNNLGAGIINVVRATQPGFARSFVPLILKTGLFDYTVDDEKDLPQDTSHLQVGGDMCLSLTAPIPSSVGFNVGVCSQGVDNP